MDKKSESIGEFVKLNTERERRLSADIVKKKRLEAKFEGETAKASDPATSQGGQTIHE